MSEIEIINLPLEQINRIKPLLAQNTFKPLRYLGNRLKDNLNSFWFNTIAELVQNKQARIFAATESDTITGIVVYTNNPWETKVLGKKAGTLNHFVIAQSSPDKEQISGRLLEYAISMAASHGIQYLLCKTCTDDVTGIHALESQGFWLMDTLVDCYYDFQKTPLIAISPPLLSDGVSMRLATKDDVDGLVSVARAAFQNHFGRYHSDERIGRESAIQFYEEWIRSSIEGYADWVCVAEIAGRLVGYSIWVKPSPLEAVQNVRVGHYSIAGIHPDYFGRGLFTALTYEGMKLLEGVADVVEGPTHINNYGVQLGYAKLGWRVCCDARHSFHKWLEVS